MGMMILWNNYMIYNWWYNYHVNYHDEIKETNTSLTIQAEGMSFTSRQFARRVKSKGVEEAWHSKYTLHFVWMASSRIMSAWRVLNAIQ